MYQLLPKAWFLLGPKPVPSGSAALTPGQNTEFVPASYYVNFQVLHGSFADYQNDDFWRE